MTGLATDAVAEFDVCGPLPAGVTVLEASAGTGKTFTIAALAARYVAEGVPLERLLLVTFTRMATGELRERVRQRLVTVALGIGQALAGGELSAADEVVRFLAGGSRDELELRQCRFARALADFDAATIDTTHGFCRQMLNELGLAADVEPGAALLEDATDLVEQVVDDLYVRKFHGDPRPPFDRAEALRIGTQAVQTIDAPIHPTGVPAGSDPDLRARLARRVRAEVQQRIRRNAVLTYDDLLTRLRDALVDPTRGAMACARLRARYHVALVDEFQDTDPVQWEIMRSAFTGPGSTLVLIGDPKQAIYAFRGADVYAYLDAAARAGTRATLGVNWRSDQGLVDAYDALFGGSRLGHPRIAYQTVRAAGDHRQPGLTGAPVDAPLRIRLVRRDDGTLRLTPKGYLNANAARERVATDVAADIAGLLSSGAGVLAQGGAPFAPGRSAPVRPGDVAVLVRRHRDAAAIRAALHDVGIPAVTSGAGSVFATGTALEWLRLLEALEQPTSARRVRSAVLTVFLGWTAEQVAGAGEEAWEVVRAKLHRWADVLRHRGVAALLEVITAGEGLPGRVLGYLEGERQLTDLRHLGELLHAAARADGLGVTSLTTWLRQRIDESADSDTESEERSRRLESDAEAVQVLTIHRSKGLEFPIVYCPYLWDAAWIDQQSLPVFHDPDNDERRTLDVGRRYQGFARHQALHRDEERGEELRLAYVALTRARHQAVIWWAPSWESRNSPLCRLLFWRDPDGTVRPEGDEPPADDEMHAHLSGLAARVPGRISVEPAGAGASMAWSRPPAVAATLEASRLDRQLDHSWRRTSYSGLTAALHDPRVASEPAETTLDDEPPAHVPTAPGPTAGPAVPDPEEARLRAVPSPMAAMTGGADVGTFLHAVLEATDFTAPDLDAALADSYEREQARHRIDVGDPAAARAGLRAAIETPLGPAVGDLRLRDLARADRLDELGFELPVGGGDRPIAEVTVAEIGPLLRAHLPGDDPLAGYPDRLDDPVLARQFRGYLAGSLDLVLRAPGPDGTPRFAVADYKSNWLGAGTEPLTAWHYRPDSLAAEMARAHYPLQALFYTVALHRYLRWRLPGYDPARHLAGVLYLFLRGMAGPDTPRVDGQPCGVFAWRPPDGLVVALSDLLDRGSRR